MTQTNSFLKEKFKTWNLKDLIWVQFEAFVLWPFNNFPGLPGMIIRNLIFSLLFKTKKGFCWTQHNVTFVHTNRLKVGAQVGINSGTYINAIGEIEIGNFVLIGSNVTISSGKHPIDGIETPVFSRPSIPLKICIEDDVWIAAGAVILPGITLKKGSVIGANAVVTKDTEPYAVYGGAPAKKISTRQRVK